MFKNQTAFTLALNFIKEDEIVSTEKYLDRLTELYEEFDAALKARKPENPMLIDDEFVNSI